MLRRADSLLVVAIGEAHQLLHVLGPAKELFKSGLHIQVLVATDWHERLIHMHAPELSSSIVRAPLFYSDRPIHHCPPRLLNLLLSIGNIFRYWAVLTPERTSTILKQLLGRHCPKLIHILHGAGDRAQGYEQRIKRFDLVLVAGKKDRDAFLSYGLTTPAACHATGYSKFDVLPESPPKFFENDQPVILYNPHFDEKLGSWLRFGPELVELFKSMPEFNFIIAPHLRLRGRGRRLLERLSTCSTAPNIRFDGGSLHSVNMNYTRAADIYLGDVSSQVYEFLRVPKPCIFLNASHAEWRGNPFYRHWTYGEVCDQPVNVATKIRSAFEDHLKYADIQKAGFTDAIETSEQTASRRAADVILQYLAASSPEGSATRSETRLIAR